MAESGRPSFHGIIGQSAVMRRLFREIELYAPSAARILIRGERGTGKELVARAVHRLSRRRDAVYLTINCGEFSPDLLASELFGHERGAFTGATERRPGVFALAHGGTLFADEIGTLSLEGQAKLLRAVELGEVRPVGGKPARVDVRLIAATNRDLERAAANGEFLPDLHDRLSEAVLEVPPLRARPEDIPGLVEYLIEEHCRRHGVTTGGITGKALRVLQEQPWPGNVRELWNVVSRAVLRCRGGWIRPQHLERAVEDQPAMTEAVRRAQDDGTPEAIPALSWRQQDALRLAAERGAIGRMDVIERWRVSREIVRREFAGLVRRGLLRRAGSGRGTRYEPLSHAGGTQGQ